MIKSFALSTDTQTKIFNIVTYITWFLYIVITLGLSVTASKYLDIVTFIFRTYVSLFLIYRFNPFRQVKFNELDGKIAFSAGLFLASSFVFNNILLYFQKYLTSFSFSKFISLPSSV